MKQAILRWTVLAQAGAFLLQGCSGDDGKPGTSALVRVSDIDPGDDCAAGGFRIETGADANRNGELDEDEIEQTQTLCQGEDGMAGADGDAAQDGEDGEDGADGFTTLVSTRELGVGDAQCAWGGLEIAAGLDDGEGEGTANDGVLQPDEVDDAKPLCRERPLFAVKPITPPEGPEGAFTIRTGGGEGSSTTGGNGGDFYSEIAPGSLGGHIKVFSTGAADASFTVPEVQAYLGDEPLEIDDDLTIVAMPAADHTGLGAGAVHTHTGSNAVFIWDGAGTDTAVTGISVAASVTLTIEPQQAGTTARIMLANDFHNAGTVTTALLADGRSKANLEIDCDVFVGEEGSKIDLSGADAPTGNNGGNGGYFDIDAEDDDVGTNQDSGAIFNYGAIDTSGGAGDNGGQGGDVLLYAHLKLVNTAQVDTRGGTGTVSTGGAAGNVYFETYYGDLSNSGALTSAGGNGEVVGGAGAPIVLYNGSRGDIRNSGDLTARGGDASEECAAACAGGAGDDVQIEVHAGSIINSGNVDTRGGFGAAGPGGAGGPLEVYGQGPSGGWQSDYQPSGNIEWSGNIDTRGGDGSQGGNGGYVEIALDTDNVPFSQEVILYGYTEVNTRGGEGPMGGGQGGYFEMYQEYADGDGFPSEYGPSGGCVNYANLDLRGGDATMGQAGDGGYVNLYTDYYYGGGTTGEIVFNAGNIDNSGGNGQSGGDPGFVYMFGFNWVENQGELISRGGNASEAGGSPGFSVGVSPHLQLTSDLGPVINSGTIDISGGDMLAAAGGGGAGLIELVGQSVDNSGDLIAAGGDSEDLGGDGGDVFLYGIASGTTNTGAIDVSGGEGDGDVGEHGTVFIDAVNVTADHL